ncbi:MFS transporter [Candidatus Berkiella aquae]|uniref:MFS transporter n=1 Tax=Candidatus Berkiella aquae TaxID=295108 RepID=A0A0Q9YWX8_9GAMM|nr:MFS transporter [Candidatus Berkiella aquae]MCS5710241.1 MFS transporter [Candidatus Berkiella aquae]
MFRFIAILLIQILVGVEIDLFTPSFPELQSVFQLSPVMVQLMLSVNFIAYCICCLFAGTLGDRYNRRYVMLLSLVLFVIGSVFCVNADQYIGLLLGRFLQGIGIAAPCTLSFVIIADEYPIEKQPGLMGTLNGLTTMAMACAPVLGSYVALYSSWRGNFFILLILGLICLAVSWFAIPHRKGDPNVSLSLKAYLPLLRSPSLLSYIAAFCLLCIPYWLFVGMSPILYMQDMGVPLNHFGFYQGATALVFASVSIFSPYILKRVGTHRCFYIGIGLCALTALMISWLLWYRIQSPMLITLMMIIFAIGAVFPINIIYPYSLEIIPNSKGRSAALNQSSRLIFTAILLETTSFFYQGNFIAVGIGMLIPLMLFFWIIQKLIVNQWLTFDSPSIALQAEHVM